MQSQFWFPPNIFPREMPKNYLNDHQYKLYKMSLYKVYDLPWYFKTHSCSPEDLSWWLWWSSHSSPVQIFRFKYCNITFFLCIHRKHLLAKNQHALWICSQSIAMPCCLANQLTWLFIHTSMFFCRHQLWTKDVTIKPMYLSQLLNFTFSPVVWSGLSIIGFVHIKYTHHKSSQCLVPVS